MVFSRIVLDCPPCPIQAWETPRLAPRPPGHLPPQDGIGISSVYSYWGSTATFARRCYAGHGGSDAACPSGPLGDNMVVSTSEHPHKSEGQQELDDALPKRCCCVMGNAVEEPDDAVRGEEQCDDGGKG